MPADHDELFSAAAGGTVLLDEVGGMPLALQPPVLSMPAPLAQTVSLVARHLETHGIATVILGSARDVVEHCGVPRFVFTDFPLGNPGGKPYDLAMQRAIVGFALDLLESARAPRTTVQTPVRWSEDQSWRDDYMRIEPAGPSVVSS